MYMRFKDGKQKVVTLSYDDGVTADKKLIEIMSEYGLKGTFNINTGLYHSEEKAYSEGTCRLKLSDAKKLYLDSENEVAVHSLTHPFLEKLNEAEMIREIVEDRNNIECEYKTIARGMAYPYGSYDDRLLCVLENCGICYSRTVLSTESFGLPENWLLLNPTCHHNNPRLMELAKSFVEVNRYPTSSMFYLWGHSYEFDNDNNWEVIEEFAKYIGGRDDIWYATNIEIYDYVKAYEGLQVSYDGKIIHNSSAIDVWAFEAGETFIIKAGETLYR